MIVFLLKWEENVREQNWEKENPFLILLSLFAASWKFSKIFTGMKNSNIS